MALPSSVNTNHEEGSLQIVCLLNCQSFDIFGTDHAAAQSL